MPRQLPANLPYAPGSTPAWVLDLLAASACFRRASENFREARALVEGPQEPDEPLDWFEAHDACSDEQQARQEHRDRYREEMA